METVLITGGTGTIGTAISKLLLDSGYNVSILTRNISRIMPRDSRLKYYGWDIEKGTIDQEAISTADHVIHLAGAGVADKRWTKKRKLEILNSRVQSGKLLVNAIQIYPNKIQAVITAAATGWYGPDPQIPNPQPFSEDDPPYPDFLGQTCKLWEDSLEPLETNGIRLVKLRASIVLSESGAVKEFLKPLKFGIATVLGSGKQIISWIHIDDLARFYLKAIEDRKMKGVYNAVTLQPVSNNRFITTLAKIKNNNRYIKIRVPAFILQIVFGELSTEVTKSVTVNNDLMRTTGFTLSYPDLLSALKSVASRV